MKNPFKKNRCPHSNVWGIFGDQINMTGGYRLRCFDCGLYLDGPVQIAELRNDEPRLLLEMQQD